MAVTKRVRKHHGVRNVFFHAEVYVRGLRVAERTFTGKTEAHVWHDQAKDKWLQKGSAVEEEQTYRFADCVRDFCDERRDRVKLSTFQSFSARLRYYKEGPLPRVLMSELDARSVDRWLDWLLAHPTRKNPGRKSFVHELKYLGIILNWYRNYKCPEFVVPIVKRHRDRCVFKRVASRRPDYYMRPEDARQWLAWLKDHRQSPVYYRLATFMLLTGTRIGEACGLKWDAVNLQEGTMRVVRTASWDHSTRQPTIVDDAKTEESIRMIHLADELVEMLMVIRGESLVPLVFHKHGEPIRYNAIQSSFNAGFRALGLPWRSTHILRHTYGTMALMATRDLGAVQAVLGHRSRSVTERYAKSVALLNRDTATKTAAVMNLSETVSSRVIPINHVQNHVLAKMEVSGIADM